MSKFSYKCSYRDCENHNLNISMFRFPVHDKNRLKQWVTNAGDPVLASLTEHELFNRRICSAHFESDMIHKSYSKTMVNRMAVPIPYQCPTVDVDQNRKDKMLRRYFHSKTMVNRMVVPIPYQCATVDVDKNIKDSMPLQQRLTANAAKEESCAPTLKSQPLSPTKLKVTRQSNLKPQNPEDGKTQGNEAVCLKWNTHHSNMQTAFPTLLSKEQYCDVTLVAEGKSLKCHKLILSSCSSYFDQILEKIMPYQHPVIFMKDIPFNILKALCDFMYAGEVNILQSDLNQILAVAESLKIKGLGNKLENELINPPTVKQKEEPHHDTPPPKLTRVTSKFSTSAYKPPSYVKKNSLKVGGDFTDPMDLLQPAYEEAAMPDLAPPTTKKTDQPRRSAGKRVRKRKHVGDDHEPSPPVFRTRKGTRSRPNVKVPRYFNASFDNSIETPQKEENLSKEPPEPPQTTEDSYIDPLIMDIMDEIKTEPLDIDDVHVSYEEESFDDSTIENSTDHLDYCGSSTSNVPFKKIRVVSSTAPCSAAKLDMTNEEKDDVPDPLNVEIGEEIESREAVINSEETHEEIPNLIENDSQEAVVDSSTSEHVEMPVESDQIENSVNAEVQEEENEEYVDEESPSIIIEMVEKSSEDIST